MTESKIVLAGSRLVSLLAFIFLLAGCANKPTANSTTERVAVSSEESKIIASVDVVKADAQPLAIKPGESGEVIVRLRIQTGYHINANPPTYRYLKATELEIPGIEGLSATAIQYPPPLNKEFAFAEKPLAVYEGEVTLKATLKADASAKQGDRSVSSKLRVQACDHQVCYAPGVLDFAIPVSIR